jgi:hypothetical protein
MNKTTSKRRKRMKTITIQYRFPNDYDHDEIVTTINGAITDMDSDLATELSYKIIGRKGNE